jgi:hypothetical protein
MNKLAALMVFLWVSGWTIAAIRACLKAKSETCPCTCRTEFRTGFTRN